MNNLRFLSNTQLTTAELDRETFSEEAITFEVAAQLVTRVGENGNEVRIDDGAPPDDGASPEGGEEPQASVDGDQYGLSGEEQYQYGPQGGGR
jgi:hypothetical protein